MRVKGLFGYHKIKELTYMGSAPIAVCFLVQNLRNKEPSLRFKN